MRLISSTVLRSGKWPVFAATSKDTSLVQASGSGNDMAVFEGFMDFLSAVTWYGPEQFSQPTLVLNAVAMRERAITAIRQRQPGQVSLYLDRDPVSRELTTLFGEQLADIPMVDASDLYAGYKDFNALPESSTNGVRPKEKSSIPLLTGSNLEELTIRMLTPLPGKWYGHICGKKQLSLSKLRQESVQE